MIIVVVMRLTRPFLVVQWLLSGCLAIAMWLFSGCYVVVGWSEVNVIYNLLYKKS